MRKVVKNTLNIILIAAVITALVSGMVLISGCKGEDMTIEEAFRFTISAGVIAPTAKQAAALPKADFESKKE